MREKGNKRKFWGSNDPNFSKSDKNSTPTSPRSSNEAEEEETERKLHQGTS